jgi:hypothetical protein
MKRYVIEMKCNPMDEWKPDRKFDSLYKANQSFEMLKKHRYSLYNNSDYMQYRLHDIVIDKYYN